MDDSNHDRGLLTGKCRILVYLGQYTVYYILLNTVNFNNQIDELKYNISMRTMKYFTAKQCFQMQAFQNSASHIFAQKSFYIMSTDNV